MGTVKKEEATMTSEEMLARSSSWTLACDNALLNRLKSFSENLSKNSHELMKECDTLSKDISQLDYKLRNVTNEFLMMANTQFVENRVEEFEEIAASVTPTTASVSIKSKSEMEAELMSKMKLAIQLGLKACDSSRLVEEKPNPDRVYRMKRPFLIGSPKFFSSKFCGLVDESRRVVPFDNLSLADSVSISPSQTDILQQPAAEASTKPVVTFTMPPTPAVPIFPVPENGPREGNSNSNTKVGNISNYMGAGMVPPSPTISDRSSDFGKPGSSNASISRENVPKSVTDELNKIYGAFSPPPTAEDDSDDDFRPNAAAGRIFEDDDDDLFAEAKLFPSSSQQKNTDFFGRSNPSQLPTPVFSAAPPPVNSVPQQQQQSAFSNNSNSQTLVGPSPKSNDIPNMNNAADDSRSSSRKDVSKNEAPSPEVEVGSARSKLPPGAVSMFTGLPPPVSNKETLQTPSSSTATAASTTKSVPASSLPSKQTTQINPPSKQTSIQHQQPPATSADNIGSVSSHHHHQVQNSVNTNAVTVPSTHPKKSDSVLSQGSLSSTGNLQRNSGNKVPSRSLFVDDSSSDEDIFKSSRKQSNPNVIHSRQQNQPQQTFIKPTEQKQPIFPSVVLNKPTGAIASTSSSSQSTKRETVKKAPVKKSIFDESDSEEDIFASRPSTSAKTGSKDLFKSEPKKLTAPTVKSTKSSSLFGDDSDSDTDLFGNKKKARKLPPPVKTAPNPTPPASISVSDPKPKIPKKMEEVEEEVSVTVTLRPPPPATPKETSPPIISNKEASTDEVENVRKISDFSNAVDGKKSEKNKKENSDNKKPKSIFDDSDSDDDLFSSKKTVTINKNVKSSKVEIDDSDSLFNNVSQKSVSNTKSKLTTPASVPKKSSLFGDESDSDSDIFSSKLSKTKKDEQKKELQKENENAEIDIFSDTVKTSVDSVSIKNTSVHEKIATNSKQKQSVFADDDSDDLFTKSKDKKIADADEKSNIILDTAKGDSSKSTKVVGNKISEKIKAMQTAQTEGASKSKSDKDGDDISSKPQLKSKVSVKNLALNLKINPLALKVGAKPPKLGGSNPTTPDKEANDNVPCSPTAEDNSSSISASVSSSSVTTGTTSTASTSATNDDATTTEGTTTRSPSISPKEELDIEEILHGKIKEEEGSDVTDKATATSSKYNDGGDHFVEIIKSRAKIQQKRRPPSKQFLRTLAIQEEPKPEEVNTDKSEGDDEKVEKEEQSESEAST